MIQVCHKTDVCYDRRHSAVDGAAAYHLQYHHVTLFHLRPTFVCLSVVACHFVSMSVAMPVAEA